MERLRPYLAIIFVQLIYAGMALFSKSAIGGGMSPFVFVVYRQAIAAAFLAPFAYFVERKGAPRLSNLLLCKIFSVALCGITLSSALYYVSLRYTSATFAAAGTNLIPSITFVMAALLRMERVAVRELHGLAKVLGSAVCVAGAMLAAFYQGPPVWLTAVHQPRRTSAHGALSSLPANAGGSGIIQRGPWAKGCLLMLAANTAWSLWLVLQGMMVQEYPAKLRLIAIQCFFSGLQSLVPATTMERNPSEWRLGWDARLISVLYCGLVVTGIAYWLQVWCIEKKGPVFTAAFTPAALLMTTIFSALLWSEVPYWGTIGGALLMVGGLYLLLWGKSREEIKLPTFGCRAEQNQIAELGVSTRI